MPSPFPGMNPYLETEDVWHDFHGRFIAAAADTLAAQVDPDYVVRTDAHLYIHEPDADHRILAGRSDVWVAEKHETGRSGASRAAVAAPARVRLPQVDVERISYIQIRARNGRTVVTVLELLSPSNKKRGADREQYLLKRAQLLASQVNYVEIDLLRGGPRMDTDRDDPLPPCDYYALVCRPQDRPRADLWPVQLRERLPVVPIPLREPDPDAHLDLQDVVHRIYDAARYASSIYEDQPVPPLAGADAEWAREIVGSCRGRD